MQTAQAIYEAAEKLSAQLTGMPNAYQAYPNTYRVDFGHFIIETNRFRALEPGESQYVVRQIWPAQQIYSFTRVREILAETLNKTFQTA